MSRLRPRTLYRWSNLPARERGPDGQVRWVVVPPGFGGRPGGAVSIRSLRRRALVERSVVRSGSRPLFRRVVHRQAAALSLAALLLLLVTAGALAATGDLSQPGGA